MGSSYKLHAVIKKRFFTLMCCRNLVWENKVFVVDEPYKTGLANRMTRILSCLVYCLCVKLFATCVAVPFKGFHFTMVLQYRISSLIIYSFHRITFRTLFQAFLWNCQHGHLFFPSWCDKISRIGQNWTSKFLTNNHLKALLV